jgi:hypothetical protein
MTRFFKETELPLYLTVVEVADLLQLCPETIARRARKKQLPTVPGLRCGAKRNCVGLADR